MTLCISPEGELLVPGTGPFYDRIGYKNPDFDASDYVVRNMGFVSIARTAQTCLKVRFRPALLTGLAVEATCRYLSRQQVAQIELNYLDGGWSTEAWPNDPALLHRIVALCSKPTKQHLAGPRFRVEPLELKNAAEDYGNPLKPLFQKWRVSFGGFDDTTLPFLMRFGFSSNLVIFGSSRFGQPLRFQFIGAGLKFYDEKALFNIIGQPIDNQPDKEYGSWAVPQYEAVVQDGRPRLDLVEAKIKQPDGQVRQSRYERMLLPWRGAGGGPVVTAASVLINAETMNGANDNSETSYPALSGDGGAGLSALGNEAFAAREQV